MINLPEYNIITRKNIKEIEYGEYNQSKCSPKPTGLWLGIYDSWYNFWFEKEGMDNIDYQYIYEVKLKQDIHTRVKRYRKSKSPRKIYIVENIEDIEYITSTYECSIIYDKIEEECDDPILRMINWEKFSERYSGIEVRNYYRGDYDFQMKHLWYYVFDINSTCLFDTSVVEELNMLRKPTKTIPKAIKARRR